MALRSIPHALLRGRGVLVLQVAARRLPLARAALTPLTRTFAVSRVRFFSVETTGEKPRPQTQSPEEESAAVDEDAQAEQDYYAEEPLAAKISRLIWGTIKLSVGLGILGFVGYAGYSIVVALLPGGASANAVMRRTSDILRADNDLVEYFGDGIKVYGEDFGGRSEGRRYFVPDFSYTDKWDGQTYHRVKFNLEGAGGKKGTVWAEVQKGTSAFRYIIVLSRDRARVWSLIDNRTPEPDEDERRLRVSTLLHERHWDFFANNDADVAAQAAVLADSWTKVRCVRCDTEPAACADAGVAGALPTWGERSSSSAPVPAARGVLSLDALEQLGRDHVSKPKTLFQTVSGYFGL